jgi:hypothetical protein
MRPIREELKKRLHIDAPCHEDWEQMTETERGKFCGVCATEVVDFERMTEAELLAFFENYSPSRPVCGSVKLQKSQPTTRWRAAAASLLIAAAVFACKPGEKNTVDKDNISNNANKSSWQSALKGEGIKGYAAKDGRKLAYATVSLISGNELLAKMQTKAGGEFVLQYPDYDAQKQPELRLRLSHMEYEGVEFPLNSDFEQGKSYELGNPTHRMGKIRVD